MALKTKISPKQAVKRVKKYLDSLDTGVSINYGAPKIVNWTVDNQAKDRKKVPYEYGVPVRVTREGSSLEFELYVHAQTGDLREAYYRPTKEQILSALEQNAQYCILVTTRNRKVAQELSDRLFAEEEVMSVSVGPRKVIDQMNANAGFAEIHGARNQERFDSYKEKDEEKQKRDKLKDSYLGTA